MTDLLPTTLPSKAELASAAYVANQVAGTDFVPDALRGNPAAVLAAVLAGRELGVGPMQALQKIHIIKGKPSPAPELMAALVLRAGHVLSIVETSNERCTVEGMRRDGPQPTRITWTMDDAKQAGLSGDSWKKYPRAMLRSRAVAELCRAVFPDVLAGFSYVPEELGADVDEDGHPLSNETATPLARGGGVSTNVVQTQIPTVDMATGEVIDVSNETASLAPIPENHAVIPVSLGPPPRKKGPSNLGPDHVPPDVQKARLEAQAALSKLELMPDEIRLGLQAVYGVDDVKGLDAEAALKLAKALTSDDKAQAFSKRALDAKAAAESWKEGER